MRKSWSRGGKGLRGYVGLMDRNPTYDPGVTCAEGAMSDWWTVIRSTKGEAFHAFSVVLLLLFSAFSA